MIAQLERTDGDIDALVTRIAHVRTWTYMSHRSSWLTDARHWQERAREVEDRLSDALHQRLTQRFVDRRTSALMRSLRDRGDHAAIVDKSGEVAVDGHVVGQIDGLNLTIVESDLDADRRLLTRRRTAGSPAGAAAQGGRAGRVPRMLRCRCPTRMRSAGRRPLWPGFGRVDVLAPRLELTVDDTLDIAAHGRVRKRLERWLGAWIAQRLAPLHALQRASRDSKLERRRTGASRSGSPSSWAIFGAKTPASLLGQPRRKPTGVRSAGSGCGLVCIISTCRSC